MDCGKRCARCGLSKPQSEFYASLKAKDGRHSYCISCLLEYSKDKDRDYQMKMRLKMMKRGDVHNMDKLCGRFGVVNFLGV